MNIFRTATACIVAATTMMLTHQVAIGQAVLNKTNSDDTNVEAASAPYGVWTTIKGKKQGDLTHVMRLKVYPQAATVPLLRHRLVPDPANRTDGNAAPAYLKAMGFVEQNNARIALSKQWQKWRDEATEQQRADYDYPPDSWREISPDKLPLDEVEKYLQLISFQEPMLYDAARRKNYSQDRAMEREPNPIGYLLPEVQQMRGLARHQILRLRYAIAQNRIDDAVEIAGQMMAMANHIGQDEFMVSSLVGVAIQGLATSEGLALSQHPSTPNLYWAIAACPSPMIELSHAIKTERLFLPRQFPMFSEVNETARSKKYWADFVKQLLPRWNEFALELNNWGQTNPFPKDMDSFQFASKIAAQYEPARRFLNEACGMSQEQLDAYPATQIAFLAMVKYHAIVMDEATSLFYLRYSDQQKLPRSPTQEKWGAELGWIATAINTFTLPFSKQLSAATTRANQRMALWQTLEALRMSASANEQMPKSLDEFVVPAPLDPATDKPFEYTASENTILLTGARIDGLRFQLRVEVATPNKEKN